MSEWKSIKVARPSLSVVSNAATKRGNSGNYISPWQLDRWSINPQSFSVVSSPSVTRNYKQNDGLNAVSSTGAFAFTRGMSMARLGTIFCLILSVFLFGMLLCVLLS